MIRISEDYETIYIDDETVSDDDETTFSDENENVSSEYETIITPAENVSSLENENLSFAARSVAGGSAPAVTAAESGGITPEGGVDTGAKITSLSISVADDVESSDIYNESGYTAYLAYFNVGSSGNIDNLARGSVQLSPGMEEQLMQFASYLNGGYSYALGFYTPSFSAVPPMCQDYVSSTNYTNYYVLNNTLMKSDSSGSTEPIKVNFQKGCRVVFTFPDGSEYVGGNNAPVPTPTPEVTPTPTPEVTPTPTPTITPEVPSDMITAVNNIQSSVQFGAFMVFVSLLFVLFRSFIRSNK